MGKLVTYGGAATGLLLVGWWLGRRSRPAGALGQTGFSTLDYTLAMPKLGTAAAKQAARAQAGSWLDDYRKAEDKSKFMSGAAYNVQAHYNAAYWMAVAARLLRSRTLAVRAATVAGKGSALYAVPGSSFFKGDVSSILSDAAGTIEGAAGKASGTQAKQALAVAKVLRVGTTMTEARQKEASERGWVAEGVKASAEDVVSAGSTAGHWLRSFMGLKDPRSGDDYPAWKRWAARGAVGVAVALLLRWYLGGTVKKIAAAAQAQIGAARSTLAEQAGAVRSKVAGFLPAPPAGAG